MNEVQKLFPNGRPLDPTAKDYRERVMEILAQNPPSIQINKFAQNSLYVPIQVVEELLDHLFPLSWSWEHKSSTLMINEIVSDGELVIDCGPVKRRLWGSGASQMQYKSGTDGVTNLDAKIKDTLGKDYPNAKSEALKNACKLLGNVFGRQINRKNQDRTPYQAAGYNGEVDVDAIVDDLKSITDRPTLISYYQSLGPTERSNPQVLAAFKATTTTATAVTTPTIANDIEL